MGIKLYPDGRISTGWFYIETNRFSVCAGETSDCEQITHYQTFIEKAPFWSLKIRNKDINRTVFVGPIIWSEALNQFYEKFPASSTKE